ncbi:hypothetical protein [Enterobacter cloacae]|uniref:hypothetical protein n=1 Tax=Enterobacteriaceae TaxID=543 RepID=UPI00188B6EB2|nr:hypothetical protein [Enterobacter cloacae]MBF4110499.1 hypothetical protein [Enterobacter cloacae]HDX9112745.1 hypothetical protein [Klebsiella michiganensis]
MKFTKERHSNRITYSQHFASGHRAFLGHFPGRPLLPGVFHFKEILSLLPPEVVGFPYVIRQAKFIKTVTTDTQLNYIIECFPAEAGNIDVVTRVEDLSQETVAKIHFVFSVGEEYAD